MENNRYREEEKEMDVAPETEIVEETKEVESDMSEENKKNKKHKKNHLYEENQALKKENAELKDQLLRNLAELENFKKRTNEERIKDRKYALADFLMQLIDTLDIFDKAVNKQTDDEKLKQDYKRLGEIYKSEMPYLSLYNNKYTVAYSTGLAGTIEPNWFYQFYNIKDWHK